MCQIFALLLLHALKRGDNLIVSHEIDNESLVSTLSEIVSHDSCGQTYDHASSSGDESSVSYHSDDSEFCFQPNFDHASPSGVVSHYSEVVSHLLECCVAQKGLFDAKKLCQIFALLLLHAIKRDDIVSHEIDNESASSEIVSHDSCGRIYDHVLSGGDESYHSDDSGFCSGQNYAYALPGDSDQSFVSHNFDYHILPGDSDQSSVSHYHVLPGDSDQSLVSHNYHVLPGHSDQSSVSHYHVLPGDSDQSFVSHHSGDSEFYFEQMDDHVLSGSGESGDSELVSQCHSPESQYSDECESAHCDGSTSSSLRNEYTAGQYQALYSGLNYRDFPVQRPTMDSQVLIHSSCMNNEIPYLVETGHDTPLSSSGGQFADMKASLTLSSKTHHISNLHKGQTSNRERKRKRQQKQHIKKRKKELKGIYSK